MIRVVVCLLCVLCINWCEAKVSEELKVVLPHGGGLIGKYMTSYGGHGIRAFLGVPYAEPPIGPLRFRQPLPKMAWEGDIPANNGSRVCPQPFGAAIVGEEDCLYLNVYVPLNPTSPGPLPVMFYIHGGGFTTGTGSPDFYGPEYFLDHDVVLVAGNYRLGTLGFISLDNPELPGNNGLKDQLLMLQWVQDNIASFNGDPQRVTIFGESAGSASVAHLLFSKLSVSLFEKAILQSGVQYAPWAFDHFDTNSEHAQTLGEALDCPIKDPKKDAEVEKFLKCMRKFTVEEIMRKGQEVFPPEMLPFKPVTEKSIEGLIQKAPRDYKRSVGLDIPIMIGVTKEEGIIMTGVLMAMYNNDFSGIDEDQIDKFIEEAITVPGVDKSRFVELVKRFYFKTGRFERATINNVTDFFSDAFFVIPFDEFLENRLVTNKNAAPTYVYQFAYGGTVSCVDILPAFGFPAVETDQDLGVSHVDDLLYLFPMGERFAPHLAPTKEDGHVQKLMTDMWVNFATNGQPTGSNTPEVEWTAASGYPVNYLRIGNHGQPEKDLVGMETGLFEERVNLWRQIYSISSGAEMDGDEQQEPSREEL